MKYIDAIIVTPNGFAPALMELIALGLGDYVKMDEESGQPTGLNKLSRFYPQVPTFFAPAILYVRGYEHDINTLLIDSNDPENPVDRFFENFNILVKCAAAGELIETGETDVDGNAITRRINIYEKLQADPEALATYQEYIFHPELLEDGTPNPKLQESIEISDGEGNLITVPNPQYEPFRNMGTWA